MIEERILVTVRTYPTISAKYTETVCTGGINDQGAWRRLYPVPLRYLENDRQYRTFDVIYVRLKPGQDGRPETYRPENQTIQVMDHLDSELARTQWIAPTVMNSMAQLIEKRLTLAPVRVSEVKDFIAEPISSEWSDTEKQKLAQEELFIDKKPLTKVPFHFRLLWVDGDGQEHKSRFISWEVHETWRKWSRNYPDVIERMKDKWLGQLFSADRNKMFFMGNLASRRKVFMVCGTYQPHSTEGKASGQLFR